MLAIQKSIFILYLVNGVYIAEIYMKLKLLKLPLTVVLFVGLLTMAPTVVFSQTQNTEGAVKSIPSQFSGEKKRVAVGKFDAVGAYALNFMGMDIGGGVSAQLTTALIDTGRFVVLERAALGDIQREQQLNAQRASSYPSIPSPSGLTDAQILIVGSVTEFEQAARGGGLNIGLNIPIGNLGVAGKSIEGHIGMDIRLINTANGHVISSKRVEAKVPSSQVTMGLVKEGMVFGGDAFNKTPLGLATRQAIEKAVGLIVREMEAVPWTGRVADLLGDQILVNAGKDTNLRVGTILRVFVVLKEVTDPGTGAVLGVIEAPQGEIQIDVVQEQFSTARLISGSLPKRGDILRLKP